MNNIPVHFVTDYVCPYCYVAKKIFLKAAEDFDVDIHWLTCESTKTSEAQMDVFHDMAKKRQYKKEITPYVKKYKIPIKLPPEVVPRPYTRLAALGGLYALEQGRKKEYDQAVMDAYFLEERDIGDEEVLLSVGETVGLDPKELHMALHCTEYQERLDEEEKRIEAEIQPKTLPTILIDESVRLEGGIYSLEKYIQFLERAKKKLDATLISIEEPIFIHEGGKEEDFTEIKIVKGQGCSIDGCY